MTAVSLTDQVRQSLPISYAIQFTGGAHEAYVDLIHETYPDPLIEVDCTDLVDYDHFFEAIGDDLVTDAARNVSDTYHVQEHFNQVEGSLVLYAFDSLDDRTIRDLAMYLKGLAEASPVRIALTVENTGAIFRGNGDLHGRVRTVDLAED